MEHADIKVEQQPATETVATPAPRPWITPTFERVPLNEALDTPGGGGDFSGRS
jgi:hypothetical protein